MRLGVKFHWPKNMIAEVARDGSGDKKRRADDAEIRMRRMVKHEVWILISLKKLEFLA